MNIIEITDFLAPELDVYARKTEAQLLNRDKPEEGLFLAESPKVIARALDAGYAPLSALVEKRLLGSGETAEILARLGDIPIYTAEFELLTQLTGFMLTRGMLCAMRRKALPTLAQVAGAGRRIAVLEDVENPTNVGAIVRSAAALGMDGVLFYGNCANPLYRRAIRVSMGTVFQIPWTFLEDLDQLKELGYETVAMALKADSLSIRDERLVKAEKLAILLGTEGEGLRPETIAACDHTVMIPMYHGVDSLNVAAASAVAFFQLTAQVQN